MTDERIEKLARKLMPGSVFYDGWWSPKVQAQAETYARRALAAIDADSGAYGYVRIRIPPVPTVHGQHGPVEVPG